MNEFPKNNFNLFYEKLTHHAIELCAAKITEAKKATADKIIKSRGVSFYNLHHDLPFLHKSYKVLYQ